MVCNKNLECCSIKKKIHVLPSQVYCVRQFVKTPTIIFNNPSEMYTDILSREYSQQFACPIYKYFDDY